jgi:hypothetical protein
MNQSWIASRKEQMMLLLVSAQKLVDRSLRGAKPEDPQDPWKNEAQYWKPW